MPGNFKKEDLRIIKTHRALMGAMFKLLELRNFSQITVNDLCEEACVSRGTFYAHFADKYDLLKRWLENIRAAITDNDGSYEGVAESVNNFTYNNGKIIKNLLENANHETSGILRVFFLSLLGIETKPSNREAMAEKYIVFCEFCAGGMLQYLLWQVKNKFPEDVPVMNRDFYNLLEFITAGLPT